VQHTAVHAGSALGGRDVGAITTTGECDAHASPTADRAGRAGPVVVSATPKPPVAHRPSAAYTVPARGATPRSGCRP
jgi:hypothetical protein